MSGGSCNYICYKIEEELCGRMEDAELNDLMKDIADLAHALEWYLSYDTSEDTYREKVNEFKHKWFHASRERRLKQYIDKSLIEIKGELYQMIGEEIKADDD